MVLAEPKNTKPEREVQASRTPSICSAACCSTVRTTLLRAADVPMEATWGGGWGSGGQQRGHREE